MPKPTEATLEPPPPSAHSPNASGLHLTDSDSATHIAATSAAVPSSSEPASPESPPPPAPQIIPDIPDTPPVPEPEQETRKLQRHDVVQVSAMTETRLPGVCFVIGDVKGTKVHGYHFTGGGQKEYVTVPLADCLYIGASHVRAQTPVSPKWASDYGV